MTHPRKTNAAFIGLGANLGDRLANLQAALRALASHGDVVAISSVYETAPVGLEDQPAFFNAALQLATPLAFVVAVHSTVLSASVAVRVAPQAAAHRPTAKVLVVVS